MTPDEKVKSVIILPWIYQTVLEYWNSKKVLKNKWKGCSGLLPHHTKAIRGLVKEGYTLKNIIDAITNYALILLGREYKWTYAWNLYEFLTRTKRYDRTDRQFYRFVEDFNDEDYMSDWALHRRKNPPLSKEVRDFYNSALPKKVEKLPQGKCAQRADIKRLKG